MNQDVHSNGSLHAPVDPGGFRRGLDWASWWLQSPDLSNGWLPFGLAAACWAAERHQCRAMYSTAPPFTTHAVALMVRNITGLPWIADFRDPWRANPFRKFPYQAHQKVDAWLEARVVHAADWVVCNSPNACADLGRRYPERKHRMVTIPNGFEPEDFLDLEPRRAVGADRLLLTHNGVFYGPRRPSPLMQALALLRERRGGHRLPCLQLVGPTEFNGKPLAQIAAEHGVADLVEVRGPVNHHESLELMSGSDIQVLVGFDGPGSDLQVPAKLYEYMALGGNVLALAPPQSAISEILRLSGTRNETCDPKNPEEIASAILRIESRLGNRPDRSGRRIDPGDEASQFHRRAQVGQLAALLDGELESRAQAALNPARPRPPRAKSDDPGRPAKPNRAAAGWAWPPLAGPTGCDLGLPADTLTTHPLASFSRAPRQPAETATRAGPVGPPGGQGTQAETRKRGHREARSTLTGRSCWF